MRVEIYGLFDQRDGRVRYIGKANDSAKRLASHMRDARRRRTPVYDWINSLNDAPSMQVLAVCDESNWPDVERIIIAQWRSIEPKLLNLAEGGDEPACSRETRAANGRKVAQLHKDPVERLIWEVKKRYGDLMRCAKHNPEAAKKIAACKEAIWERPLDFAHAMLGKERCDAFCADIENRLSQCHS